MLVPNGGILLALIRGTTGLGRAPLAKLKFLLVKTQLVEMTPLKPLCIVGA